MSSKDDTSPLVNSMRGVKPKTAADYDGVDARRFLQDAKPPRIPEPSQEERLRGSCPPGTRKGY